MASLFAGKQLHAFFQDPAYWGNGQSFRDLRLKVDGRQIGHEDFQSGWDPSDIPEDSCVEVVGGIWDGRGYTLAEVSMPQVIEGWLLGVKPSRPKVAQEDAVIDDIDCSISEPKACVVASSLARPSFLQSKIPSGPVGNDPPRIRRPVFSN